MFGRFDFPCRYLFKDISMRIDPDGNLFRYRRECGQEQIEKIIPSPGATVFVHPVEPINLPREITRFLEIVFPPLQMEPDSTKKIFLTFPLETGVFLAAKDDYQLLDVFSRCSPKYSLYGSPESGVLTRYHESELFTEIPPDPDPALHGILELDIRNTSRGWVEVSRVVFNSYFMPVYFSDIAGMVGEMVIFSKMMAETRILDRPLRKGMELAIPVIRARKVLNVDIGKKEYLMEHGVG